MVHFAKEEASEKITALIYGVRTSRTVCFSLAKCLLNRPGI